MDNARRWIVGTLILPVAFAAVLAGCGAPQQPRSPETSPSPPAGQEATAPPEATGQPAQPDASSGEALVKERCTVCHSVQRIKNASKDAEEWTATVRRMRRNGAKLTDAEEAQVVEFLASGGAQKL